jgi:hypothetical protein
MFLCLYCHSIANGERALYCALAYEYLDQRWSSQSKYMDSYDRGVRFSLLSQRIRDLYIVCDCTLLKLVVAHHSKWQKEFVCGYRELLCSSDGIPMDMHTLWHQGAKA